MNDRIENLMKDPKRGLLILSWPMIVSTLFSMTMYFADAIFVGGLGPEALTAIGLSFPIFFLIIAIGMGVNIGTTSLIAKRMGEKNRKWAEETAMHSLVLAGVGAAIMTMLVVFVGPISAGLGGGPVASRMAAEYLGVLFSGAVIFFFLFSMQAILQGEGDTKTPMKLSIFYNVLNIILDPIFIYNMNMGISGAALATVLSAGAALLIYVWFVLLKKKTYLKIAPSGFIYTPQIFKNILKVGLPAAVSQIGLSVAVLGVNWILSGFGDNAIAAYTAGFRIDSLAIMPILGLSAGVIPMVGFYRGAKDFVGARKVSRLACQLVVGYGAAIGVIIFFSAGFLPGLFTDNLEVISMATDYLRVIAFAYPFIGVIIVLSSAFQGLGRGMPSLVLTMSRAAVLMIPICFYLAYYTDLGVYGVWIGLTLSMITTAIFAITWIEMYYRKLCGVRK